MRHKDKPSGKLIINTIDFRIYIPSLNMSLEEAADLIYQHANNCIDCLVGKYKGIFVVDFIVENKEDIGKSINDLIRAVGLFDCSLFKSADVPLTKIYDQKGEGNVEERN